jgi:hypothetical protein
MKHTQPYIKVKKNQKNETIILVKDYELFDFINDFLSEERNFDFEAFIGIDNHTDENKWNEINMGTKLSVEKIKKEIKKIDSNEIERISPRSR